MAMPKKDTLLVAWGSNFDVKVTLAPTTYNLTAAQATSFHSAYVAFLAAFNAVATAREAGSRSKLLTNTKDTARANLYHVGRELYGIVQDSNSVTNANKLDIGVTPKNTTPSPIPAPGSAPGLDIVSVIGATVRIRLHDTASSAKKGKPPGVAGASVFSFIGASAPSDIGAWKFEGNSGKVIVDINFSSSITPGSKVWLTAFWFNNRKQSGPLCDAVGANLPGGSVSLAA